MVLVRRFFVTVLVVSLAALPVRVSAITIAADSDAIVSEMTGKHMTVVTRDVMPISQDCDMTGDHGTKNPGACYTYCNAVPLLPTTALIMTDVVFADAMFSSIGVSMHGIGLSPEPPPPKRI